MDGVLTALLYPASFLVVLGIVIVVHELGHYQVGRWCGIAVDTFSLGFGKPLISRKDKSGVTWQIARFPLGGYVKFAGDADAASMGPSQQIDDPVAFAEARRKGYFHAQPVWKRALTVAAGPLTNFVFAVLAIALMVQVFGRPDGAAVGNVLPGSAGAEAGLQAGDKIVSINGRAITDFEGMRLQVQEAAGKTLAFGVERGDQALTLNATIKGVAGEGGRVVGQLGVQSSGRQPFTPVNPLEAVAFGVERTGFVIGATVDYIGKVFTGRESGNQISGAVGIFAITGQESQQAVTGTRDAGEMILSLLVTWFQLAANLSIAVGFANLLPVPVLDGGHLVYYGIEAARGRPLSARAQEFGFRAGLVAIASLFLFATWNDLQRLKVFEFLGGVISNG